MSYMPMNYDYINSEVSRNSPNAIHASNTGLSKFFERYLLQKAQAVYKWKMPETWAENYFLNSLYAYGYISVIRTNVFGVIPQHCGLLGFNVMYQPTHATIANPLLSGILQPRIGSECTVIKMQNDYGGIMDIVSYYADMMAIAAETAGINLFNSKLSYVFRGTGKAGIATLQKMYDKISAGEPAAFVDSATIGDGKSWELFEQNVGNNYIAGQVMDDMRKWEQMFLTQIGVPNANTQKKERLVVDEVNSNNIEVKTLSDIWLENFKKGCKETNDLFGEDLLSVEYRFKEEVGSDAVVSNDNGIV